jgi:hypothetical protein
VKRIEARLPFEQDDATLYGRILTKPKAYAYAADEMAHVLRQVMKSK